MYLVIIRKNTAEHKKSKNKRIPKHKLMIAVFLDFFGKLLIRPT